MKFLLQAENTAKFLFAWWLTTFLGYSWWVFLAWLLAPDFSMVGYLINTKVGAWSYNLFHHQGVALICGLAGFYYHYPELMFLGALLFGHSAMDRALGYGLKHNDNFKHTHLGWIGNPNRP